MKTKAAAKAPSLKARKYRPTSLLGSPAATDMRLYFQVLPSRMGAKAQNVDGGGGGRQAADVGWKSDSTVDATGIHRRIREGLMQLSPTHFRILELGWEPRQRPPELVQFFGEHLVNLVLESQLTKDVKDHHGSGKSHPTVVAWLVKLAPKGGGVILALRQHAEDVLQDALDQYAAVRVREKREARETAPRAPRKEQGIPFLMGGGRV